MLENYEAYMGNNHCGSMNYLENSGRAEHMLSDILPDDAVRKISLFGLSSRKARKNKKIA